MTSYNKLPGQPKSSPREELANCLKDFEKKLKDLKRLVTDSNPHNHKALMTTGDDCINLKNQISALLKAPVPNNEKQIMDRLRKSAEELFRQFVGLENAMEAKKQHAIEEEPRESFESGGFVEQQDLAIRDEDDLSKGNLVKRNEEIQQVHKDFVEVNSLFKEVATLVDQQGEALNEADKHVDTAVKETTRANIELDSANNYQRSAKKKMMVIFIIVCIIVSILIGVVVAVTS